MTVQQGLVLAGAFLLPCAIAAAGILRARRGPPWWLFAATMIVPALALGVVYADAAWRDRGDKAIVEITALSFAPLRFAEIAPGGRAEFLLVGDSPEVADLVVTPSSDPRRALADRAARPRIPLAFVATRDVDGALTLGLRLALYEPEPAYDLPGMRAVIAGEPPPEDQAPSFVPLAGSEPVTVRIERIEPDGTPRVRRSLTVQPGADGGALRIGFDTPLRANAGSCRDETGEPRLDLRLQPAGEAGGAARYLPPDRLVFDALGRGGRTPLLDAAMLGPVAEPAAICGAANGAFAWPVANSNRTAWFDMRSHTVSLPRFLPLYLLAAGLALALAAWRFLPNAAIAASLPLVSALLGYRLVIAVAAPYYDAAIRREAVYADGVLAAIGLPALLIALFAGRTAARSAHLGLAIIVLAASGGFLIWLEAGPSPVAAWPVLAALFAIGWRLGGSPLPLWEQRRERLTGGREDQAVAGIEPRLLPPAILIAGAGIARFALAGPPFHAQERVFGLPLSVPYYAALIAGFAAYLAILQRGERRPGPASIGLLLALAAFTLLLVPFWVRDIGFAFVAAPPFLALLAVVALKRTWHPLARLALAAPLVTLPLAVWGAAEFFAARAAPPPDVGLLGQIAHMLAFDGNVVRLVQFADPARLYDLATLSAFAALEQQHLLSRLTEGLWGEGWLAPADLHLLRPVQLSDNAAAIHLMWPFGRLALLPILALVFLFARAAMAAGGEATGGLAAWLAAAVFAWTAAYMVLANLLLVPFVGRNVYFLSPTSGGDLIEATMLVAIAAAPLHRRAAA